VLQQIENLSSDQRKLLKLFKKLEKKDQDVLISFAEFLNKRDGTFVDEPKQELSLDPIKIDRPENESVVAAIKRLSSSYHMLDTSKLLTETSSLMTAHLVQGKSAPDVIDELEYLFNREYEAFLTNSDS
jgi:hypothetical protein